MAAKQVELNPEKIGKMAEAAFGFLGGAVVAGMIYLGDELGLYRSMAGLGPVTSKQLAKKTGLNERWLREWLRGQGAAGLLDYGGEGKFELSPEAALVLADEDNPASGIGGFSDLPAQLAVLAHLGESFRTGIGRTYDQGGLATARGIERMLGPWNKTALITEALPKLAGVVAKLEAGALVADVGCGAGLADVAIAKAFPKSQVHGFDNSKVALRRAAANKKSAGLKNLTFHNADADPMPDAATYDLVLCLDCLHDMTRPDLAAKAIRRAIKPDGTWFIVDVDCSPDFEENMKNPMGSMMYSFSILTCMSSSSSSEDGLALGTLGLPEPEMAKLVKKAGFKRFARVPGLEHPFNAYYEAHA